MTYPNSEGQCVVVWVILIDSRIIHECNLQLKQACLVLDRPGCLILYYMLQNLFIDKRDDSFPNANWLLPEGCYPWGKQIMLIQTYQNAEISGKNVKCRKVFRLPYKAQNTQIEYQFRFLHEIYKFFLLALALWWCHFFSFLVILFQKLLIKLPLIGSSHVSQQCLGLPITLLLHQPT